jgi:hypothetical protein
MGIQKKNVHEIPRKFYEKLMNKKNFSKKLDHSIK